jgi:hypothetical protein
MAMQDSNLERMQGKPQAEVKHPPEWERDLNPDRMAGQNIGAEPDREVELRTAYDVKPLHRAMEGFGDDELKQVPVLPAGERLEQGATYLDLRDPGRGEFTATGDMAAGQENAYVAKDQVPYETWNRLRGIRDPERT